MPLNNFSPTVETPAHRLETEEMDKILGLILQGKYSTACLLLLESTGQDPLHYIPYRTYNRLQKQRQQAALASAEANREKLRATENSLRSRLSDLDYVETVSDESASMPGGTASSIEPCWLQAATFSQAKKVVYSISTQYLPFWQLCCNRGWYARSWQPSY